MKVAGTTTATAAAATRTRTATTTTTTRTTRTPAMIPIRQVKCTVRKDSVEKYTFATLYV